MRSWHWRLFISALVCGVIIVAAWYTMNAQRRGLEREMQLGESGARPRVDVPDRVRAVHGVPSTSTTASAANPPALGSRSGASCDPPYIDLGGTRVTKPGCK